MMSAQKLPHIPEARVELFNQVCWTEYVIRVYLATGM